MFTSLTPLVSEAHHGKTLLLRQSERREEEGPLLFATRNLNKNLKLK